MARRKAQYTTRDPQPVSRDPEHEIKKAADGLGITPEQVKKDMSNVSFRKPRRYIPASAPTVCPDCGHSTRMDDGRHVDPVRKTILEYRTCCHCKKKLAAGRPMTPVEVRKHCDMAEAVAEYEQTVR